jgi:phi13 family phage major tail protein
MATIGLRDLYYAKVTPGTETTPDTYAAPKLLAGAINVGIETTTAEAVLYASDSISEQIKEFVSAKVTINADDITLEKQAELLGQQITTEGIIAAGGDDDAPYYAIGFRARKRGNVFRYVWLLKGKFAPPKEEYQTKGSSIEFKTPTIEGTFMLGNNDKWKTDFVGAETTETAKDWFTEVQEITPEA